MKRKRMIKLLMSLGCERNTAAQFATLAGGNLSYAALYYNLCEELVRALREAQRELILYGEHPGEPAGMVGRHG